MSDGARALRIQLLIGFMCVALIVYFVLLGRAAFILIGGKTGDLIGRKRAYLLGLVGYAIGAQRDGEFDLGTLLRGRGRG